MELVRLLVLSALAGMSAILFAHAFKSAPAVAHWSMFGVVGSGHTINDGRSLEGFTRITDHGSANLEVNVGADEARVTVVADDNVAPLIETSVIGGTLSISSHGMWHSRHSPLVRIDVPNLDAVSLKGSGDATITDMNGSSLALDGFGSGDFKAAGSVDNLTVNGFGSGEFALAGLEAQTVSVRLHGSGDAHVNANDRLDVDTFGSGDVTYRGDPSQVSRRIRGSGEVTQEN